MITAETIHACEKEALPGLVPGLETGDIDQLVAWLSEKDDNFRYKCFLLLQERSRQARDVYPYWDAFVEKLNSPNSYQRSLGLMLIAENARWDEEGKFDAIVETYLTFCDDEKPITARQCIQSLVKIVPHQKNCHGRVIERLISIDLMQRKETQRKLLLLDILAVLKEIQKIGPDGRIERFIQEVLEGEILDGKAKRLVAEEAV
jgi:hypothetical protein